MEFSEEGERRAGAVIEETDMEMDTSLRNSQDEFVICFHVAIAP